MFYFGQVSVCFSLSRVRRPSLMECVFHCDVEEGLVTPGSVLKVPVSFTPRTVDSISVDYFSLTCPGGISKELLKLTGSCTGENHQKSSTHTWSVRSGFYTGESGFHTRFFIISVVVWLRLVSISMIMQVQTFV